MLIGKKLLIAFISLIVSVVVIFLLIALRIHELLFLRLFNLGDNYVLGAGVSVIFIGYLIFRGVGNVLSKTMNVDFEGGGNSAHEEYVLDIFRQNWGKWLPHGEIKSMLHQAGVNLLTLDILVSKKKIEVSERKVEGTNTVEKSYRITRQ